MKKSYFLSDTLKLKKVDNANTYTFYADKKVTKHYIKEYFRLLYNLTPKKLNIINVTKTKRTNNRKPSLKKHESYKKLIVKL